MCVYILYMYICICVRGQFLALTFGSRYYVNFSVSVNFYLLPPPLPYEMYARTRVCKCACIHVLRRRTCWMQPARECVRGSTASRCCSAYERACDRTLGRRYTLRQLAGVPARNTPEECTTAPLHPPPFPPRLPDSPAGALAVPFSSPLVLLPRYVRTRGRIWYQARHSWYFRKFDALPMSRGKGVARDMRGLRRTAGRSAVKRPSGRSQRGFLPGVLEYGGRPAGRYILN